jgi:ABC-type uncharacterized transport system substrate-binding protein
MALTIGRRQFMSALAGATVPWPLAAQAQQPAPVIGWLFGISSEAGQPTLAAFRKTLGDAGYVTFTANADSEFEGVFAAMEQRQAAALLVGADPFFNSRRAHLIALAAQHRLPAIYEWRQFAVDGGLMSYGTVLTDAYAQAGTYAGRILNGEKPADLPVVQPTNFQFVINLKTAKALGLQISPTLSARADDVIE